MLDLSFELQYTDCVCQFVMRRTWNDQIGPHVGRYIMTKGLARDKHVKLVREIGLHEFANTTPS